MHDWSIAFSAFLNSPCLQEKIDTYQFVSLAELYSKTGMEIKTLEHGHTIKEIRDRIGAKSKQTYLGDFIYGGIDGTITTFAIVAGVKGAGFSSSVIVVLGIANILADGFSMAASNYLGTKAELDNEERIREIEERHIKSVPEGERAEVREILILRGLKGTELETTLKAITSDHDSWINFMLREEYGISSLNKHPFYSGFMTFISFLLFGLVPLAPFIISSSNEFILSAIATAITFFCIGTLKSKWSLIAWWRSGVETLLIGSTAATIAYLAGYFISQFT